jgi:hypothetical protein
MSKIFGLGSQSEVEWASCEDGTGLEFYRSRLLVKKWKPRA